MRIPPLLLAAVSIMALASAAPGEDGFIPGVFAYTSGKFYVTATKPDHNVVVIAHSSDDLHLLITLNGNQISYPLVGVAGVSYQGGAGGFDTLTLDNAGAGTTNQQPPLGATLFGGHNSVTLTGGASIDAYGDQNAFTALAGSRLSVWVHGGVDNSYSGSGVISTSIDTATYTPTAIPGVFRNGVGLFIVGARAGGNQISVTANAAVQGVTVSENGQSVTCASFAMTDPITFVGGGNGADSFTNHTSAGSLLTVWGDANQLTCAGSLYCWSTLYGNNDTVTMGSSVDNEVNLYGTGTTLHGTFKSVTNADGVIVPLPGTILSNAGGGTTSGGTTATGGTTAGSTTSVGGSGAGGTTSTGSASAGGATGGSGGAASGGGTGPTGGGSGGCGLGASAAVLLAATLLRRRHR